jgi:hypothetical protein
MHTVWCLLRASQCISLPVTSLTFAGSSPNDALMEIRTCGHSRRSRFSGASASANGRAQKCYLAFDISHIPTCDRGKDWAIGCLPISISAKNLPSEHARIRLLNAFSCVLFTSIYTCSCALLL